ncbi:CASP-like protein 5A1 [Impatiens glandulifera]|uniref:CASP-like protein 5A1 n=1 Tax=Impatiens glandulifera TaxID=253017 RepID=UPI001FB0D1F3|nr:CASP-like protein 5A1 [Impatiens glandulifera]
MSPISHLLVHLVEALSLSPPPPPPLLLEHDGNEPSRPRMNDIPGRPETVGGLILRLSQVVFVATALCIMATTNDFSFVTVFRHLVAVVGIQCLWSLSLAIADIYALLVGRCLQNNKLVALFAIGDGITSTLTRFQIARAMAFLRWFSVFSSFLLNS